MRAYRVQKVITQNGSLQLEALPFQAGEVVEIIVLARERSEEEKTPLHALKGSVLEYQEPTEPVAEHEWDVLQ